MPAFRAVHITDSDFADTAIEAELLAPAGATLARHACHSAADVIDACRAAEALIVQWAPITREVVAGLPQLKAIARLGVGVDMIDVAAASELGVAVCNTPNYCVEEVALHALSLLLALARRLASLPSAVAAHRWGFSALDGPIPRLSEQTLGLIGVGRIGGRLAQYARALGLSVIAYDPYVSTSELPPVPLVSLDELLARSDYVSVHCPLTAETRNLVNAQALARMRPSAYLINVSRGAIVDSAALNTALRAGALAGAGLDVLPKEPPDWADPILTAPNLILTPHLAWYGAGAPERMRREAATALVQLMAGERPAGLLNPGVLAGPRWARS
jgi:D-3-phosphoglycerate dehydrogenase / 2-oxoglutarate reductase